MSKDFELKLANFVNECKKNNYEDNFFKEGKKVLTPIRRIKIFIYNILYSLGLVFWKKDARDILIESFKYLYGCVEDEYSKDLMIKVLTYRLLGHKRVKLPMNDGKYLQKIKKIEKNLLNKNNYIQTNFNDWKLYLFDLAVYGFPAKIYYTPKGIYHRFVNREYEYKPLGIRARKGDIVVDAGACYGDTAIYFAELVGSKGKVYSFEFSEANLKILYRNLNLNPRYRKRIKVVEKAIWSATDIEIDESNRGPGNRIVLSKEMGDLSSNRYRTLSLDDFVEQQKIKSIDFIKMDIEGAELEALKGSENVLRKYRPTLVVSVYHKPTDCYDIPKYIKSLNLGYKFYFDHYSVYDQESVLFMKAR